MYIFLYSIPIISLVPLNINPPVTYEACDSKYILITGKIQDLSIPSQELGAETSLFPFWVAGMPGAGASKGKG